MKPLFSVYLPIVVFSKLTLAYDFDDYHLRKLWVIRTGKGERYRMYDAPEKLSSISRFQLGPDPALKVKMISPVTSPLSLCFSGDENFSLTMESNSQPSCDLISNQDHSSKDNFLWNCSLPISPIISGDALYVHHGEFNAGCTADQTSSHHFSVAWFEYQPILRQQSLKFNQTNSNFMPSGAEQNEPNEYGYYGGTGSNDFPKPPSHAPYFNAEPELTITLPGYYDLSLKKQEAYQINWEVDDQQNKVLITLTQNGIEQMAELTLDDWHILRESGITLDRVKMHQLIKCLLLIDREQQVLLNDMNILLKNQNLIFEYDAKIENHHLIKDTLNRLIHLPTYRDVLTHQIFEALKDGSSQQGSHQHLLYLISLQESLLHIYNEPHQAGIRTTGRSKRKPKGTRKKQQTSSCSVTDQHKRSLQNTVTSSQPSGDGQSPDDPDKPNHTHLRLCPVCNGGVCIHFKNGTSEKSIKGKITKIKIHTDSTQSKTGRLKRANDSAQIIKNMMDESSRKVKIISQFIKKFRTKLIHPDSIRVFPIQAGPPTPGEDLDGKPQQNEEYKILISIMDSDIELLQSSVSEEIKSAMDFLLQSQVAEGFFDLKKNTREYNTYMQTRMTALDLLALHLSISTTYLNDGLVAHDNLRVHFTSNPEFWKHIKLLYLFEKEFLIILSTYNQDQYNQSPNPLTPSTSRKKLLKPHSTGLFQTKNIYQFVFKFNNLLMTLLGDELLRYYYNPYQPDPDYFKKLRRYFFGICISFEKRTTYFLKYIEIPDNKYLKKEDSLKQHLNNQEAKMQFFTYISYIFTQNDVFLDKYKKYDSKFYIGEINGSVQNIFSEELTTLREKNNVLGNIHLYITDQDHSEISSKLDYFEIEFLKSIAGLMLKYDPLIISSTKNISLLVKSETDRGKSFSPEEMSNFINNYTIEGGVRACLIKINDWISELDITTDLSESQAIVNKIQTLTEDLETWFTSFFSNTTILADTKLKEFMEKIQSYSHSAIKLLREKIGHRDELILTAIRELSKEIKMEKEKNKDSNKQYLLTDHLRKTVTERPLNSVKEINIIDSESEENPSIIVDNNAFFSKAYNSLIKKEIR